jgi:hypothetical protein
MGKKSLLLSMTFINMFEGNCGTFGKETKNPLLSMTVSQFAQEK